MDGPAKSESPVKNGGKHPIIHRVGFNHPFGGGFRTHPQYLPVNSQIGPKRVFRGGPLRPTEWELSQRPPELSV